MNTLKDKNIGQIVAEDYRTAHIFHKNKLDFCCNGGHTIEEACSEKAAEASEVIQAIATLEQEGEQEDNYNNWSLDFLTDYIINNHHEYTRSKIPELHKYAHKVAKVHGDSHPELPKIEMTFTMLASHMTSHMSKEERSLFPYIKKLVAGDAREIATFKEEAHIDPVLMLKHDHDEVGRKLAQIRGLTNDYTLPDDACHTYMAFYKTLEEFEKDMHKHIHLENNILFPKTRKMDEDL